MSDEPLVAGTLVALLRGNDATPLHSQVEDGLRRLIHSGQILAGTELPGELMLAKALGMSRHTIRHAMNTLVNEGLLERHRGRGTHVLDSGNLHIRRLDQFYAFAWEMAARGIEERSTVLGLTTVVAVPELSGRLGLRPDSKVVRVDRIRTADGEPLILETMFLPLDLAGSFDRQALEHGSIYDEIERVHGLRVTRAQEVMRPTILSRQQARHLGVTSGSAAFKIERTTWAGARPIEWQESIVRGDRYLYTVEVGRNGTR